MYKIYSNKWSILKLYTLKILFIMRLTTAILIASMLQVSATTLAQRLTYVKKGATLNMVFKELIKQTNYNLVWNEKEINAETKVDANFRKATIEEVLNKCFSNLPFKFTVSGNNVIIKGKEPSLADKVLSLFTSIDVRGRVLDEDDAPLVGAIVKVKGSTLSTATNSNGEFLLKNVDENATLIISFLGYESQEIKASKNPASVKLILSTDKLQEVEINAGYYTVKERERTGAISKLSAINIQKQPVSNPLMSLVGRVPGLQVTQQTGIPGGGFSVQIRGQNSIKSGNDPLYIVDGAIYTSGRIVNSNTEVMGGTVNVSPLSLINPTDIESIEVLRDADATAIYGSRGANGVILITTKKGKQGKTKIDLAYSQGVSDVPQRLDLMNTEEYINMRKVAFKNDGLLFGAADYDVNGTWDQSAYTDWQKELIGGQASTKNASLNVTGGSANNSYIIGGNYHDEGTVFPGDFGFKRIGMRTNVNLGSIEDRFRAEITVNYNHTKTNLFSAANLTGLIQLSPNHPAPYDEYGQLNWSNNTVINNPMALLLQTRDNEIDNLIGTAALNYRIWRNLKLRTSVNYSKIISKEIQITPLSSISPASSLYTANSRVSKFGNNYSNSLLVEPVLNYDGLAWKGKFNALLGMSFQDDESSLSITSGSGFATDDIMKNIGAAPTVKSDGYSVSQYRYIAAFARLNYNILERYILNLTARRDGSTRFGPGKQFANFGAIGAAWIFSEEKFAKKYVPFLSFGKLRFSAGTTGNDRIPDYGYLQLWSVVVAGSSSTYQGTTAFSPPSNAPNADYAWETTRKLEGAIQLGFLKNRINLELALFRNRSSNQLLQQALSLSTGLNTVQRNLPAIVQNTGLELDGDVNILNYNNFKWSSSFNLTIPRNKLISYPGLSTSGDAAIYVIGEPLNIVKGYNATVNTQTGLYNFEDKNNSGTLDNGDRYVPLFLGQKLYGGVQNSFNYKRFSLDFHITFVQQNATAYSPNFQAGYFTQGQYNHIRNSNAVWQQPGDVASRQKYSTTSANAVSNINAKSTSLFVNDASYLKLRNVSLSWSLPNNWLSTMKISNATITLQGQNLYTLSNYQGLDPETQGIALPPLRTVMLGVNVTF